MLPSHCLSSEFDMETMSPFGVMIRPGMEGTDTTEVPVPVARELAREHHLLVLRGFEPFPGAEELARYAASWGQLLTWPFGAVLELVEHEHPSDHIFDNTGVSFHWDGIFAKRVPEFQIFQCVGALDDGQGGRTTFCDTTRILASAAPATRMLWEGLTLTYRVAKESHYGGTTTSPLVIAHPDRGFPTMRYLEPVPDNIDYLNRPRVEFHDVAAECVADIEHSLREALYDPHHCYAHSWQAGDVVVADNYTLLHGREPYGNKCGRHLRRVHVLGDPPLTNHAFIDPPGDTST
ncbi:MAG: TauD/TfdA dioxygenase family protein [Pseudonocardiaceae bacterium]